jgi:hypothetical protein
MALENEELQQAMEELRQAFGALAGEVDGTAGGLRRLTEAEKKLKSKLDLTMQGLGGVAKFGAAIGKGETDLKAFNGIIDTATGLIGSLAKTVPVFGDALAGLAKGIGEASKMAVDALDNTAKSFVEIGKVGGLTARGMSGVREQFIRSGLSLQSFQKQVVENAEALAQFRGLTGEGASDFASIVGDLTQGTDDSLRRLGLNAEEIAGTTAAFVKQQTLLGRAQSMGNKELAQGTREYAKELDLISKITGQNRAAIQQQQEAALSENKFRAVYEDMMANGQEKQAKALMGFQTVISGLDKEAGQGLRDLSSGVADTAAGRKILISTNGAAADIIDRLKTGQIDQAQAQIELKNAIGGNIETMRQQGQYNKDAGEVFIGLAGAYKLQRAQFDKYGNVIEEAKKTQSEQASGADSMTDATVKAQRGLEGMSQQLNLLGFTLLPKSAEVVAAFTTAMTAAIKGINKALGIDSSGVAAAKADNVAASQGSTADMITGGATAQLTPQESAAYAAKQGAAGSYAGLRIKGGADGQATAGGQANPKLIEVANLIQDKLGGNLNHFTGFNDKFHMDRNSKHNQGTALDFTITDPSMAAEVAAMVKGIPGISNVLDEYNKPSAGATGGHIHAEISARNGFSGMISGPSSGYRPNLTMHGTESISVQPNPNTGSSSPNSDSSIMSQQLAKLEELVTVMKSQVSISNKLLSYSS